LTDDPYKHSGRGIGIFITGTDTGVGKTLVTAAVGLGLKRLNVGSVGAMKPIETGCVRRNDRLVPADAVFLTRLLGLDDPGERICPVRFRHGLAPMSSAALERRRIRKRDWFRPFGSLLGKYDWLLVEGAGGVMVPISKDYFFSDLIRDMDVPCIIVARTGLGTINHTLLTTSHMRLKGIPVLGIVFNRSSGRARVADILGPKVASTLAGIPVLGVVRPINGVTKARLLSAGEPIAREVVRASRKCV